MMASNKNASTATCWITKAQALSNHMKIVYTDIK